ncbi:MAG: CDP-alcohol phosphatidyltransferase family protein [Phycisphaerales bacterium]
MNESRLGIDITEDDRRDDERAARRLRRRRRRRRRRVKAIAVLPSLFTLGNLIAGFAAIHFASKSIDLDIGVRGWSSLEVAGALVFIGMFFDAIDGAVARITRTTSDMGAALDSLSDIVTFGVAPAYMTLQLVSKYYLTGEEAQSIINPIDDDAFARIFWLIAAIYVACAALRLARFQVETASHDVLDHMFFRGLPSPGAAGALASLILLHQHYLGETDYPWAARVTALGMSFILLLCAIGMVSRLPYVHVTNRYIRGDANFGYIVRITIIALSAVFFTTEILAIAFTLYALSAPTRSLMRSRHRRQGIPPPSTVTE